MFEKIITFTGILQIVVVSVMCGWYLFDTRASRRKAKKELAEFKEEMNARVAEINRILNRTKPKLVVNNGRSKLK